jgi:hypothetical protein
MNHTGDIIVEKYWFWKWDYCWRCKLIFGKLNFFSIFWIRKKFSKIN